MKLNILDFGAVGDGKTLNTNAFAKACDIAANAPDGGAVIVVPPGTFVSGTIDLPSNTTLHLELGATLKASADAKDFKANPHIYPFNPELRPKGQSRGLPLYFIGATNQHDVIIDGDGTIDGTGHAFWEDVCFDDKPWVPNSPDYPVHYRVMRPKAKRPVVISFWKCERVTVRNVRIVDASAYTVWPQGCKEVRIQDITIRNLVQGPNTDALDIDCSENVIISGCDIAAGDDCIALKSDTTRIGENLPCRNIAVSNCILASTACGVRIGYEGDGDITDCAFSNLVIYNTKSAIDMLSLTPIPRPDFKKGTTIERVQFTNVSMRNVACAFHIWCGTENTEQPYTSHVRDLTFSDINAVTRCGAFIGSKDGAAIRNVSLRNVRIRRDEHPYYADKDHPDYPGVWASNHLPDVLWVHRIENLRMDGVDLESEYVANPTAGGTLLRWDKIDRFVMDNQPMPADGSIPLP